MDAEYILRLRRTKDVLELSRKTYDSVTRELQSLVFDLEKQCDHLYPNGSTASEGGFMFTYCTICGANDL